MCLLYITNSSGLVFLEYDINLIFGWVELYNPVNSWINSFQDVYIISLRVECIGVKASLHSY